MLKRLLIFFLILPCFFCVVPSMAQNSSDPESFVRDLSQKAIRIISDKQVNESERQLRFRKLFTATVDLPEISKFVLGRYWRTASPEQQQNFIKLFEDLYVVTWSQRFKEYDGQTINVTGSTADGDKGWIVQSNVARNNSNAVMSVQWKLANTADGSLRIADITVEGVSMALTQRQDFSASLQANGGDLKALFANIRTKIDQLALGN